MTDMAAGSRALGRALLATAIAVGLVCLAGCGRRQSETAEFKDAQPLPAEPLVKTLPSVGRYGGRFVLAETSNPKTFNGLMANETSSTDITQDQLFIGLADFDKRTQTDVPMLAKSWELAEDGVTWTFHLRQGARFSDGHAITAEDVLFSFEVTYDEMLHPPGRDLLIMNGKKWEVSAPDPYTVVLRMPAPNAMAVALASNVLVMPKHVLEPAFRAGTFASAYNVSTPPDQIVTSGPWRIQQYVPGEKTVLTRNPYWFGVDQEKHRLPYLNELIYLIVPDFDAVDLKFRSGEIDAIGDDVKPANFKWYEDHQKDGNFTLHDLGPRLSSNFFWFNLVTIKKPTAGKKIGEPYVGATKYAWFNNPVFRRAVSMAVDRDAMIPSVFFGYAVKNWATTTAGNKLWFSPDIVKYDYNVAEAKRLLASLGWKDTNGDGVLEDTHGNPIAFSLKTNSNNNLRIGMSNFIKDDLAKVGIKVNFTPADFNSIIANIQEDYQYDAVLLGLQTGVPPDPGQGQNVWRSSGRTHQWNPRQAKPETPEEARIDQLMDVIVSAPEFAKRKAAWVEIQNIVNEQCWFIWLPSNVLKLPIRNRFGNFEPTVIPHVLVRDIDEVYVKARS
jgi:peptide/nickel transport system substrate-binding protein